MISKRNPIKELAISGGGIRGIAFVAALVELERRGILQLKKIAATSIGAFIAICLMAGYTPQELLDKLWNWPLNTIKDIDLDNFKNSYSILCGQELKNFFILILSEKGVVDLSLKELYERSNIELYISICCVNTGKIEYFSHKEVPQINIITLLMMATAIPGILPPIKWNNRLYVDGAIIDNCPMSQLSRDAWCIRPKRSSEKVEPNGILSYFIAIIHIFYKKSREEYKNTIEVDTCNVRVTSFNLTIDQKMALVVAGKGAVKRIF